MVRVFNARMELIATHLKDQPGRFRTDPSHIASEKISGVERGASYLLRRISLVGPQSYSWAQTMIERRGIEGVRVLQGLLAMTGRYPADDLERACGLALSHGAFRLQALRALLKDPTKQLQLIESHPLIRPMDFYGRIIRVSFGKEKDDTNDDNGNDEFIASKDAGGSLQTEGPVRSAQMGPPAVHPPVSALGSLSSGALSSGPAWESVPGQSASVNSDVEGTHHEEQCAGRPKEAAPERHGPVARAAATGSPRQLPDPRGVSGTHPPG
jgi:hypothetical protein